MDYHSRGKHEETLEDRNENFNVKSPNRFGSFFTEDQVNDVDVDKKICR